MALPKIAGGKWFVATTAFWGFIFASVSLASRLGVLCPCRIREFLKGAEVKSRRVIGKTTTTTITVVARQGRQLQRYTSCGRRLVVGCIPYKLNMDDPSTDEIDKAMQVLVISSQKGHGMMFPKGGWESDETIKQAASREALEEAGVHGHIESKLGRWMYKSNRNNVFYEGIMFPLNVTEELASWPEMEVRKRRWVTVAEAREGCQHLWMREALETLLTRLERLSRKQNSDE
ncbi:Nudix hydrolase 18, mitochondrial [Apostasia shenzhenica]|uniref:Nudix hydrolase 18, mitochondrial n=1 Tax=Apostasia shenzhenica TaxID=1088818 RepID=A0A2I0B0J0_9ASPA|nr:Nudix hydrolase 18, mitochondrial [Apostasia shenzhenica]